MSSTAQHNLRHSLEEERSTMEAFSPASVSTVYSSDLPVRTACDYCRSRKIRCDKTAAEEGGCSRCRKEGQACNYDIREPIGRPKKRKTGEWSPSQSPLGDYKGKTRDYPMRRKSRAAKPLSETVIQQEVVTSRDPTIPSWQKPSSSSTSRSSPQESITIDSTSASTSGTSFDRSSYTSIETIRHPNDQPTLSDLGLAAFLESLDTLEINTADGLTANMLQSLNSGALSSYGAQNGSSNLYNAAAPSQLSFGSVLDTQSSTSYAVPADLSWADPTWLLNPDVYKPGQGAATRGMPLSAVKSISPSRQDGATLKKEGPCPKTGKESCCCGEKDNEVELIAKSAGSESRVHCVPNPNGQGCTCLCDVSVALINVRATLRQAREQTSDDHEINQETKGGTASTLQLTLSASQAVADQCACSASCPTCRSDPSTSMSASLLISTALQIYVRAVRTLRQGFASDGEELDVSLGSFKPKPHNAKRIALFAMKLELRDLRDAIAKVSVAADEAAHAEESIATSETGTSRGSKVMEGLDPIDNVVIRKLDQQLDSLLTMVESMSE